MLYNSCLSAVMLPRHCDQDTAEACAEEAKANRSAAEHFGEAQGDMPPVEQASALQAISLSASALTAMLCSNRSAAALKQLQCILCSLPFCLCLDSVALQQQCLQLLDDITFITSTSDS